MRTMLCAFKIALCSTLSEEGVSLADEILENLSRDDMCSPAVGWILRTAARASKAPEAPVPQRRSELITGGAA